MNTPYQPASRLRRTAIPINHPRPPAGGKWLPLTHGQCALVDAALWGSLVQFTWYAWRSSPESSYYARRTHRWMEGGKQRTKSIFMHRQILGEPPEGMVADHINGNTLDNRRWNLRFATHAQNRANSRAKSGTGFLGVREAPGGFMGTVIYKAQRFETEVCKSVTLAALLRDELAVEKYGKFARLNFPPKSGIVLARSASGKVVGWLENGIPHSEG